MQDLTHYQKYKDSIKIWRENNKDEWNEYQRNYRKKKNEQIKKDLEKFYQLQNILKN